MRVRNGDRDRVVPELRGEFTRSQERLVLPAITIRVGAEPWKPLRDLVDRMPIFEQFVTGAGSTSGVSNHRMAPVDVEREDLAGLQRTGKLDPHHGVDDRVFQWFAVGKCDSLDVTAALPVSEFEMLSHRSD